MDKGAKVLCWLIGILAVIMLGIYIYLGSVNKTIPRELEFPESGLSQSIFDSQNMKYEGNNSLTETHYFQKSPYKIDMLDTDAAKVSEYGVVYEISDSMYFYVTEYEKGTNLETTIRSELSKAVMVDANADMTAIDNYVYDEGYLNGFKSDYYINAMAVTNGSRNVSVYLTGYSMTITDETKDYGWKMFICVMTASSDTETYANAKGMLDAVIKTYQYDSDTDNYLYNERASELEAQERARREAEEEGRTYIAPQSQTPNESLIVGTDGSGTDFAARTEGQLQQTPDNPTGVTQQQLQQMQGITSDTQGTIQNDMIPQDRYLTNNNNAAAGAGAAAGAQIPQQKTKVLTLDALYENVTLDYYYENVDNEVSVILENPTGTARLSPVSMVDGKAVFKLNRMEPGKWHVLITGDAGSDSMKLYSESVQAQGPAQDDRNIKAETQVGEPSQPVEASEQAQ